MSLVRSCSVTQGTQLGALQWPRGGEEDPLQWPGRKVWEGGDKCTFIADSRCCIAETNRTLSSSYPPIKNKIQTSDSLLTSVVGPKAGLCHHPLPSFPLLVPSLVQPQHLPWASWILLDLKSQNQNLIFPLTLLTYGPICPMPLCVWPFYFSTGVNNWFLKDSLLRLKIPFSPKNEASFTSYAGQHTNTTLGIIGHPAPTFLSLLTPWFGSSRASPHLSLGMLQL